MERFRFGSKELQDLHNKRIPVWDGVSLDRFGNRRMAYVYPASLAGYTYEVQTVSLITQYVIEADKVVPRIVKEYYIDKE